MKPILLAATAALAASLACAEAPRRPKAGHPIIGAWSMMVPGTDCEETYYMRQDGTSLFTSGDEEGESVYEIDDEPAGQGFYKFTNRILKDNGKPDCAGTVTNPGAELNMYLKFHPSGDLMVLCRDESLDACIGPLYRVGGESS